MKAVLLACVALPGLICHAQGTLVINEVQPSNQTTLITSEGRSPDWIELYNPSRRTIDLQGWKFVLGENEHAIAGELLVPPRGFRLLYFSGHPSAGNDHIPFKLPRKGGSLLMIAADGARIIDLFIWPELFADESMGRIPDGGTGWRFFSDPTPGASNNKAGGTDRRTPPVIADPLPGTFDLPPEIELRSDAPIIRYTTDGSEPSIENGETYTKPLEFDRTTALRAKSFSSSNVASQEFAGTFLSKQDENAIAMIIDPQRMWSTFDRNGRSNDPRAEQLVHLQLPGDRKSMPVGIRLSGSGTRSLPKRSFHIHARARYNSPDDPFRFADSTGTDEAILRADAGPHAFLRNTLMETIVLQNGLSLAVQPSRPVPLVINGDYNGLYRWMPPKDAQWLRQVIGADEVDVLDGPGFEPIAGNDVHFRKGFHHLIGGSPLDSIAAYFDLESLIDLACIDLFTGRADHDLNVRVYRDRNGGKWRWILYDMDLWAPVNDNSLERMITAPATETPFLPQLLGNAELRKELMARIAALIAGPLDPQYAIAIADSIHDRNSEALKRDHERWKDELKNPSPEESLEEMKEFLRSRGSVVLEQLARYTDHQLVEVTIDVPERAIASMELNGIGLRPGKRKIRMFRGIPMEISIGPIEGTIFQGWSGHSAKDRTITIEPAKTRKLRPRLK